MAYGVRARGLPRGLLWPVLRLPAVLLAVALAAFLLMKTSPVDPVDAYLGPAMAHLGPERKAEIAARWALDRPAGEQFLHWARNLLAGDWGFSTSFNAPVAEVLRARLGPSALLAGGAWLLSGLLGFGLALVAAGWRGRWPDRLIKGYCYLLAATPTFWLAMLLLLLFSVALRWTPVCCAGPIGVPAEEVTVAMRLAHLILPLAVLTLFGVAQVALHVRAKLVEVLASDHVLLARAQGAGRWDILLRHGAPNAALPAITILFASTGEIFGGSILAEQVFAWPGLGRATVQAGLQGDVALLLAITLVTAAVVASANTVADLLYRLVDPRLHRGAS
ncbi:ABC transporter permease [Haematobacter sp.]|uniref:ABC transporter permease n=1 Tax=Haematobacter sp. TaxID=2953762 RepID=UPI0028A8C724|nr:ABC transporter permease [Haematobacter sp.]